MTDRDRLIELLEQAKEKAKGTLGSMNNGFGAWYADYILADGWIRPPCKVGDTVYVITSDSPIGIEETKVSQIKIKVKENGKVSYRISAPCVYDTWGEAYWTFCAFEFGKTVFLTKSQAEVALKNEQEKL